MKPKISIIIPVYNMEDYIRKSLESIVSQSIGLENLEVIIIDDCSTDKSGEIIDEYNSKYENFISIHLPENSGAAGKPRNIGINRATSKFLMFLDADDYYDVNACETLYNKIVTENVDIVFSNYIYVFENRTQKLQNFFGDRAEIKVNIIDNEPILFKINPSIWTKIIRKKFIKDNNIKFPEGIPSQDLVFIVHAFLKANGIIFLNNYLGYYYNRIRDSRGNIGISRSYNNKNLNGMIKAYQQTFYILKKNEKEEFFPFIFEGILQIWLMGFIISSINSSEKKLLLEKSYLLFEELKIYNFNPKKELLPLFNDISKKRYDEAIIISEILKNYIKNGNKQQLKLNTLEKELSKLTSDIAQLLKSNNHLKSDLTELLKINNHLKSNRDFNMDSVKKIFSISMVKNEMDIIESFVRYNINILDGMIILDNGSTDGTIEILRLLKKEGLSLFIIEDKDKDFNKVIKFDNLVKIAINEFEADIIVPLDADEFIISSAKGNPREILEKLEFPNYYVFKWKTYIPNFSKDRDEKFIPSKITYVRDDSLENFYKVVIPRKLVEKFNVKIAKGSHNLKYDPQFENKLKREIITDLQMAHFPIRSKEQTISKISVGWINNLSSIESKENQSWHWQNIFNHLKENEKIEDDDIVNFAKTYALENEKTNVKIEEEPIDLSFCENIEIKYTNEKVNSLANLLGACESLSMNNLDLKLDKLELEMKYSKLKEDKFIKEKQLKDKIEEYKNSNSWIITAPIRKLIGSCKRALKS